MYSSKINSNIIIAPASAYSSPVLGCVEVPAQGGAHWAAQHAPALALAIADLPTNKL